MGNEITKPQNQISALSNMLSADSVASGFKKALGNHADTFIASIIEVCSNDSALKQCAPANICKEALRAAVLKLPLTKSLGLAYLVPFRNKGVPTATFIIGYLGLIQLAQRSGQYKTINAGPVYEGELVNIDKLSGEIDLSGEKKSEKVVGYFAHFKLVSGFSKTLYMTVKDMAKYAKAYSKSIPRDTTSEMLEKYAEESFIRDNASLGWTGGFHQMAIKTVLRRILKWGPLSVEMQEAMSSDDEANEIEPKSYDNQIQDAVAEEVPEEPSQDKNGDCNTINPGF